MIYIDAITVALVCKDCGARIVLEAPIEPADVAVAEQEHVTAHLQMMGVVA